MHIEKNVHDSIIDILLNILGKAKDGLPSRLDSVDMRLHLDLLHQFEEHHTFLPPSCFTLSKVEKKNYGGNI